MTDTTTTDERQVRGRIKPGLYRVYWHNEEGHSVCAIGIEANGDNWIAPTNWISPATVRKLDSGDWAIIDRLEEIDTRPAPEAPTARAEALREAANLDLIAEAVSNGLDDRIPARDIAAYVQEAILDLIDQPARDQELTSPFGDNNPPV